MFPAFEAGPDSNEPLFRSAEDGSGGTDEGGPDSGRINWPPRAPSRGIPTPSGPAGVSGFCIDPTFVPSPEPSWYTGALSFAASPFKLLVINSFPGVTRPFPTRKFGGLRASNESAIGGLRTINQDSNKHRFSATYLRIILLKNN